MPISMRSANRALAIALVLATSGALAQDSARNRIEREGDRAMERVKDAVEAAREGQQIPDPKLPAPAQTDIRKRAFEGLSKHRSSLEMERRANAARATGEAAMAAQRELMAQRLAEALGLQTGETEAIAKAAAPSRPAWVPVMFVSSSMPIPVLRAYAQQLERVRGVMAFRGMPGGLKRAGPMARLSAQILRIDPGCEGPACAMRDVQLIVDPLIFRQHGVARVPALAMVPGDPTAPYCERNDDSPRANHIVYGDAALSGMIDEYRRIGGAAEVHNVQALLGGA